MWEDECHGERTQANRLTTPDQPAAPDAPVRLWSMFGPRVRRVGGLLVQSLPAVGVGLYGIVRISYSIYYGQFGIQPSDVGLSFGESITRAMYYVLYVVITIPLFIGIVAALFVGAPYLFWKLFERWVLRQGRGNPIGSVVPRFKLEGHIRQIRLAAGWSLVAMMVLSTTILLPVMSYLSGRAVLDNAEIFKPGLFSEVLSPGFQATPVRLFKTDAPAGSLDIRDGDCYRLLGTSGGLYVLYDPLKHLVIRSPVGRTIMVSDPSRSNTC